MVMKSMQGCITCEIFFDQDRKSDLIGWRCTRPSVARRTIT